MALQMAFITNALSPLGSSCPPAPSTGPRTPHQSSKEDGFSMITTHSVTLWTHVGVMTDPEGTSETTLLCPGTV